MFRFFLHRGPTVVGTLSLLGNLFGVVKEASEPTIPAENWANKELIRQDRMKGISEKEFSKNLANGKYKLYESHPEPHRTPDGKILIENCRLYNEDVKNYGAYKAQQWMRQGKYNLSPEEAEKERQRCEKEMEHLFSLVR